MSLLPDSPRLPQSALQPVGGRGGLTIWRGSGGWLGDRLGSETELAGTRALDRLLPPVSSGASQSLTAVRDHQRYLWPDAADSRCQLSSLFSLWAAVWKEDTVRGCPLHSCCPRGAGSLAAGWALSVACGCPQGIGPVASSCSQFGLSTPWVRALAVVLAPLSAQLPADVHLGRWPMTTKYLGPCHALESPR